MHPDLFDALVDFDEPVYRNIRSIRVSQALHEDIAASAEDQAIALAAAALGKPPSEAPLLTRPLDYGVDIVYPFLPESLHRTRFSDGSRYGVWYGSREIETTVHETGYHWARFVRASYGGLNTELRSDRRVFTARVRALLVDLRGKEKRYPDLLHRSDYAFANEVGRYLHDQGQNGVLVQSARCDGTNIDVFRPQALSDVRDRCYLSYRFVPTSDRLVVERVPGRIWLRIKV
ncbi:MAG: RES family NAD+ phosphorylase [Gammaproteobacteria bacterium]|nr:RES family NAD+ phosphorylase [Gammaproteobacteria bacterium]